ncbi:MAG: hypothetical protein CMG08_06565, partial [Candidatus Marinimicrobia bacterium]|nr:hypothetical protein [Candidatus Neomarinimicrobiota bacterium]
TNQIVIGEGAVGHGDNITVVGNTDMTAWHPADDNGVDLGSSSYEFKDVYVDGITYTDAIGFGTVSMTLPTSDGSNGQVLTTNGSGALAWASNIGSGAANLNALSDALKENYSLYVGSDPSSTTNSADNNTALGVEALDAVTTGDRNVILGTYAFTRNTTGSDNVAMGYNAGERNTSGSSNVGMGRDILGSNTTGSRNIAIGYAALDGPDTENDNIAIGYDALGGSIVGGEKNIAIGNYAMDALTTGDYNVGVGYDALTDNTEGDFVTALGYNALTNNTTGDNNTALGSATLMYNTTGEKNTAVGMNSQNATTTGSNNTSMGDGAGDVITTGSNNVIIGESSDPSANNASNQIVIGQGATGLGDNYAVIGNASITRLYAAQDGAGVLYANGTIQSSDRRIKKEINDLAYGLSFIKRLRPVSYYKLHPKHYPQELKDKFYPNGKIREHSDENLDRLQLGFIAQEVKELAEEMNIENNIVSVDEDGFHRMDYEKIVVPLVKAVQEQQGQIEALQAQIELLISRQAASISTEAGSEE